MGIPLSVAFICMLIAIAGLVFNAFPPIAVWATYVLTFVFMLSQNLPVYYFCLFIRNDKALTGRYNEFQIQTVIVLDFVTNLLMVIIMLVGGTSLIQDACEKGYEASYDGVSCISV